MRNIRKQKEQKPNDKNELTKKYPHFLKEMDFPETVFEMIYSDYLKQELHNLLFVDIKTLQVQFMAFKFNVKQFLSFHFFKNKIRMFFFRDQRMMNY